MSLIDLLDLKYVGFKSYYPYLLASSQVINSLGIWSIHLAYCVYYAAFSVTYS